MLGDPWRTTMSSISNNRTRCLTWLAVLTGIVLSVSGCNYPGKEDLWADCCILFIVKDRSAIPEGPKTIIAWQRETLFGGDGSASDSPGEGHPRETWKKQRIQADLASFLAGNPERPAAAYFVGLGMSCMTRAVSSKDAATRCEIELPIWIRCSSLNVFLPWRQPVPRGLEKPMLAHLSMSVGVSANVVLDVSTRVDPIPGGHLCHL
jgi:hypothetical protein